MPGSTPVELVRAAVAAFNEGDVDGYLAYVAPTCERWIVGLDQPFSFEDVGDGLRQMHAAFDGLRLDAWALFGDDQFVCARWRMRGTQVRDFMGVAPSGRSIDVETCEVYEFADERVATSWVYGDVMQLMRQLAGEEDPE
jgi:predicted ester cyclase